jgi:hypothetical protein
MSHFTTIKTQMVDAEHIIQALSDLGYRYEVGPTQIKGFGGRTQVDIKISTRGYDIGLRKTSDGYIIVADWWGVRGVKQKEFEQQLKQRYAYHAAVAKLEAQGFTLVQEETQEAQRIHLVLRRVQ